jgi:hypothetical protein
MDQASYGRTALQMHNHFFVPYNRIRAMLHLTSPEIPLPAACQGRSIAVKVAVEERQLGSGTCRLNSEEA